MPVLVEIWSHLDCRPNRTNVKLSDLSWHGEVARESNDESKMNQSWAGTCPPSVFVNSSGASANRNSHSLVNLRMTRRSAQCPEKLLRFDYTRRTIAVSCWIDDFDDWATSEELPTGLFSRALEGRLGRAGLRSFSDRRRHAP